MTDGGPNGSADQWHERWHERHAWAVAAAAADSGGGGGSVRL